MDVAHAPRIHLISVLDVNASRVHPAKHVKLLMDVPHQIDFNVRDVGIALYMILLTLLT
jgi:hypothetical protein